LLESFHVDPWPTWRYRLGGSVIEKTLMLIWAHDAVAVSYRHLEGAPVRLTASPVVVSRPLAVVANHEPPAVNGAAKPPRATRRESEERRDETLAPVPLVQGMPGRVCVRLTEQSPTLTLWHNG